MWSGLVTDLWRFVDPANILVSNKARPNWRILTEVDFVAFRIANVFRIRSIVE